LPNILRNDKFDITLNSPKRTIVNKSPKAIYKKIDFLTLKEKEALKNIRIREKNIVDRLYFDNINKSVNRSNLFKDEGNKGRDYHRKVSSNIIKTESSEMNELTTILKKFNDYENGKRNKVKLMSYNL
jgi:hypothetical protein